MKDTEGRYIPIDGSRRSPNKWPVRQLTTWLLVALLVFFGMVYSMMIEPTWLRVKTIRLAPSPTLRIIHFSDFHYKGDAHYARKVRQRINEIEADFVCFTGDLVEDRVFLDSARNIISQINKPVYGVPGNHDYWSGISFERVAKAFEATGGAWLKDESVFLDAFNVTISGESGYREALERELGRKVVSQDRMDQPREGSKHIWLAHYPSSVTKVLGKARFDAILAGHSHGGQIRLPVMGALVLPFNVREYDRGLYETEAGPLYVNPGIGTFLLDVRFLCRPEITVIEL